jgi:hypothetical protein
MNSDSNGSFKRQIQPAYREPGEVVWASILNPFENKGSIGKQRPAILICEVGGFWKVMGLTTRANYASGLPRVPIPNYADLGLRGPGYLWGDGLTRISTLDIGNHIGWIDLDTVEAIDRLCPLPQAVLDSLRKSARGSHDAA